MLPLPRTAGGWWRFLRMVLSARKTGHRWGYAFYCARADHYLNYLNKTNR